MIKELIKDKELLKQRSTYATKADLSVVQDLIDTAESLGLTYLSAPQIGVFKKIAIIYINIWKRWQVIVNPLRIKGTQSFRWKIDECPNCGKVKMRVPEKSVYVVMQDENMRATKRMFYHKYGCWYFHIENHVRGNCIGGEENGFK